VVQSSDISASFLFRDRSFSLIYFAGMTHDAMPDLLVRCGYLIIGEAQYNAPFQEVLNTIEVVERPRNNIVRKAAYRISGGSVLLDPEMVVAFLHAEVVARLCAEHRADAFAAGWERVSKSVFARHIGANGVLADVDLVGGTHQGADQSAGGHYQCTEPRQPPGLSCRRGSPA
jgi:hypothetical protein